MLVPELSSYISGLQPKKLQLRGFGINPGRFPDCTEDLGMRLKVTMNGVYSYTGMQCVVAELMCGIPNRGTSSKKSPSSTACSSTDLVSEDVPWKELYMSSFSMAMML